MKFGHEVVKRLVVGTLEMGSGKEKSVLQFFVRLSASGVVSEDSFVKGFQRCWVAVDDLELDVPGARKGLSQLTRLCVEGSLLPETQFVSLK